MALPSKISSWVSSSTMLKTYSTSQPSEDYLKVNVLFIFHPAKLTSKSSSFKDFFSSQIESRKQTPERFKVNVGKITRWHANIVCLRWGEDDNFCKVLFSACIFSHSFIITSWTNEFSFSLLSECCWFCFIRCSRSSSRHL